MPVKDKRKLAAIMFADVVGYSRMMASNEERTLELLKDFENICSPIISKHDGEIIKKVGDELFCEFSSAKQAVDSALAIQEAIQPYNDSRPKDFKLQVRIGIHVGDIVLRDGDVFGDGVNVASRIQPFASPGGICVSNAVKEAISSHPIYNIVSEGQQELKNIIEKHTLYRVETGFESIEKNKEYKKINVKKNYIWVIIPIIIILFITPYFLYKTRNIDDLINNNFMIHFSSDDRLMKNFLNAELGKQISSYNLIDKTSLNLIRKNVIPQINSHIAALDIYPYYSENNNEYKIMEKLPMFDPSYKNNENIRDSIPELAQRYDSKLKEINKVFEYFSNKYNKHIDIYISIQIAFVTYRDEKNLIWNFLTYYKDINREKFNDGFWGICKDCDLQWNEDSLQFVYDEISWVVSDFMKEKRFGGSFVGNVKEILDANLISIDLKNTRIVKGMILNGHRIWVYNKGEETLNQYISDKEDVINYYKNNPDELEELRTKEDWRPTHWYQSAINIDELLLFFENEIDSLRNNFDEILTDWESKAFLRQWDGIMQYDIEIIKVSDNEAIGKIISKKAPYVTPQIGDVLEIDND